MADDAIMVIGAHTTDAEVMGGAQVLVHVAAGWRAVLVHCTLGEKGHPRLDPAVYGEQKRREAEAAAGVLGASCVFLPYRDGELPVNEEVQWQIADLIRLHRPTVILTHWKGSFHRDHRNTHLNVVEALYLAGLPAFQRTHPAHAPRAVYFCENWEDMEEYQPDIFFDVTAVFDRYLEAIRCYELVRGGISRFPYARYYDALSIVRGAVAGFERAVTLMLPGRARIQRRQSLLG